LALAVSAAPGRADRAAALALDDAPPLQPTTSSSTTVPQPEKARAEPTYVGAGPAAAYHVPAYLWGWLVDGTAAGAAYLGYKAQRWYESNGVSWAGLMPLVSMPQPKLSLALAEQRFSMRQGFVSSLIAPLAFAGVVYGGVELSAMAQSLPSLSWMCLVSFGVASWVLGENHIFEVKEARWGAAQALAALALRQRFCFKAVRVAEDNGSVLKATLIFNPQDADYLDLCREFYQAYRAVNIPFLVQVQLPLAALTLTTMVSYMVSSPGSAMSAVAAAL